MSTAAAALTTSAKAVDQETLHKAIPHARVQVRGNRILNLSNATFATGSTPEASTEAFRRRMASQFGAEPDELIPAKLQHGRQTAIARPEAEGFMPDAETGEYKFWMFR